jgi:hypothetical protein
MVSKDSDFVQELATGNRESGAKTGHRRHFKGETEII